MQLNYCKIMDYSLPVFSRGVYFQELYNPRGNNEK